MDIRENTCPACGYHVAVQFLKENNQPLATLAWPADIDSAEKLLKFPLDFVRCVNCGHIYNAKFDYHCVPYSQNPNLMFNKGALWSEFINNIQKKIIEFIPDNPVVIEIGHGDGSFLHSLSNLCPSGKFTGFDPHGVKMEETYGSLSLTFRNELFIPFEHFAELKPDLIISRHVLEHLVNPLGFLQQLSVAADVHSLSPVSYFEVPCIDRVLETGRTVDFYYEHSSQFTSNSFREMLKQSTLAIDQIGYGYEGEVIYCFSGIRSDNKSINIMDESKGFYDINETALETIKAQLDDLCQSGMKVAIWGGTGKSSAFICRYELDRIRFPIVIDSDQNKVGTYVPGTGQEIKFRDWLFTHPVDIIVIPPQWRARDIIYEIAENNISYSQILIEHNGRLINFDTELHPY
ncbi:MAG: methyltransferase domain-containing protein [Gammaproteobacteria bacterium]|nr:methyltransferase domain-containing protein [Gammaproteobacteria bacterium]